MSQTIDDIDYEIWLELRVIFFVTFFAYKKSFFYFDCEKFSSNNKFWAVLHYVRITPSEAVRD